MRKRLQLVVTGLGSASLLTTLLVAVPPTLPIGDRPAQIQAMSDAEEGAILAADARRTLAFEANVGQSDPEVRFLARGRDSMLFLTPDEAVLRVGKGDDVVRMRAEGANPAPEMEGIEPLPGRVSYYSGSDPAQWQPDVPTYAKVAYRDVYPGIDAVYYGNQGEIEYDFVVAPGADPTGIALAFDGTEDVRVDEAGELVLGLEGGEVRQRRPVVYQEGQAGREPVAGSYVLRDDRVGFDLGAYDRSRPLVIDPIILVYSTYLGGGAYDYGRGIAVDDAGYAVVTGNTQSADFPTKNEIMGNYDPHFQGDDDAFVTRFDPSGSAVVYSTYLSAGGYAEGRRVAIDGAGNAYVAGTAGGERFPTTPGAFQSCDEGGAFVVKLTPAGALLYGTCIGGSYIDEGVGLAVDGGGHAYVVGETRSDDFPTAGPLQASRTGEGDAFVAKLNTTGSGLVYSTYLGGSARDSAWGVAVDASGSAYVAGITRSTDFPLAGTPLDRTLGGLSDVFVAKLNASGSALVYSTYLGGSGTDGHFTQVPMGVAVDGAGRVYVADSTNSTDFPTTTGALQTVFQGGNYDAFVAKLNASGSALVYATYLGGSAEDGDNTMVDLALDGSGSAYVTGSTWSANFPSVNAFKSSSGPDAFVTKLNPLGTALVYSTHLGGSFTDGRNGDAIALDADGNAYVTGLTESVDFPTKNPYQPLMAGDPTDSFNAGDAFVTKFDPFLGFLRITTNPALPSQVSVDGVVRATYGTINLEVTPGSHQVCFRAVEGFATPACQTVTVNNSAVTTANGNFTAKGFLQVVTNPALPAKITVDGHARDDWGIFTDLDVGTRRVCFGKVKDYSPPACRDVTVTAGQTTTVTGNYTLNPGAAGEPAGDGALRVTTNPALPSQVSVDGIPRSTYGLINLQLAPGDHQVCFRDVEGFVTPACRTVSITAGQTTATEGKFNPKGFLQVVTSPALPAAIYVDGVARDDWGIFTDLPAGTHEVCFGRVAGYRSPPCQTVNLTGPTVTVTGSYTAK